MDRRNFLKNTSMYIGGILLIGKRLFLGSPKRQGVEKITGKEWVNITKECSLRPIGISYFGFGDPSGKVLKEDKQQVGIAGFQINYQGYMLFNYEFGEDNIYLPKYKTKGKRGTWEKTSVSPPMLKDWVLIKKEHGIQIWAIKQE